VAVVPVRLPSRPRRSDRSIVPAVEQLAHQIVVSDLFAGYTISEKKNPGAVWILIGVGQPDRLTFSVSIRLAAMGRNTRSL
jgi:hypothetical protein